MWEIFLSIVWMECLHLVPYGEHPLFTKMLNFPLETTHHTIRMCCNIYTIQYACVRSHVYIIINFVSVCLCVCMCVGGWVGVCACVHVCLCMSACMCVYIAMCVCVHACESKGMW